MKGGYMNEDRSKARSFASGYFKFTKAMAVVSGVILFLAMLHLVADVLGRYLANRPLPATAEISTIALVTIIFVSLAYAQASGQIIKLEFLSSRLSPRWQAMIDILSLAIGLSLFLLIAVQALGWVFESFQAKETMFAANYPIPFWPAKFTYFVGASMLTIQYVIDIVHKCYKLLKAGQEQEM
jgi:TRAP-type C4-dicarboxylate transport system permease small subunit